MAIEKSFADEAERLAYNVPSTGVMKTFYQRSGAGSYWRPVKSGAGAGVWERVGASGVSTVDDGATVTVDMSASDVKHVTLAGNRTLAFSGEVPGSVVTLLVKQDAEGSRTLDSSAAVWPSGTAPTLTTTAGYTDVLTFIVDADGNVLGTAVINFNTSGA